MPLSNNRKMGPVKGLSCHANVITWMLLLLSIASLISVSQSLGWPHANKRQSQKLSLKMKNARPIKALAKNDGAELTNSLSIVAKTLTDSYYSKDSVVSVRQQPSILDLAHHLSGPGFSNLENDIISASCRVSGQRQSSNSGNQQEQPPEDEDDEYDEEYETDNLVPLIAPTGDVPDTTVGQNKKRKLDVAEESKPDDMLSNVTKKVISMGKVVLKATKLVTGLSFNLIGLVITKPVKGAITKVVRERKLSACSKMSLGTVVTENDKLLSLINANKCNFGVNLKHSLLNLKVSLNMLKCYVISSISGRQINNDEIESFNEIIVDMTKSLLVTEKTFQRNSIQTTNLAGNQLFSEAVESQLSDLQGKFNELLCNDLLQRLSMYDTFLPAFTINLQQMMRDISDGIYTYKTQQIANIDTTAATVKDDADVHILRQYCQATLSSGEVLADDIRQLGTTTVDKLIKSAKTIVGSFEGIASTVSRGVDQLNSYKDMYDQLVTVAKGLKSDAPDDD